MLPIISPEVRLSDAAHTWSYSKYKTYKECNEQYSFAYLMRVPWEPPTHKPFFQGRVSHNLLEDGFEALTKGSLSPSELEAWVVEKLPAEFYKQAEKIDDWQGDAELAKALVEAEELARNYAKLIVDNGLYGPGVECEHLVGTFQKPLILDNGLRLTGYVDWLKVDGDTAVVLDAKTSRNMRYIDQDQLLFYAISVEKKFGVKVNRVAWMMIRTGTTLWYDITDADKERLVNNLLGASKTVVNMDIRSFPSQFLCGDCHYAESCSKYANWILHPDGSMDAEF